MTRMRGVANARDGGFRRIDVQARPHPPAGAAGGERDHLVERVHACFTVVGVRVDQDVVEQRAVTLAYGGKAWTNDAQVSIARDANHALCG